jgi:hypothetical protein
MNDQDQEAAESRHPLILTVPAYNFVVALHPDCLGWSNGGALSAKNLAKEVEPVEQTLVCRQKLRATAQALVQQNQYAIRYY